QLGLIAAVGAAFTGEYHVGLGQTVEEAFSAYLAKLSGVAPTTPETPTQLDRDTKIKNIVQIFAEKELEIVRPTAISVPLTFLEKEIDYDDEGDFEDVKNTINDFIIKWVTEGGTKRVLIWEEGENVNFGVVTVFEGITEVHYMAVRVGT
ncbi:MAG: UPF0182 family protein, partial [Nitrososphaerales archaeon]